MVPVYELAPERVVVPEPACVSVPDPEMAFATVSALLRSKTNAALLTTAPLPSVPVVPPLPSWSVPAETVVVPA